PFATGALPLFLGHATRLAEYHLGAPKAYRATICFGAASTTDDLEGELSPVGEVPGRAAVEAAFPSLRGEIEQRPPAFSAIQVGGRRAYAAARAGETPVLAARRVTIHRLEMLEWDGTDPARPLAVVEVECSAGTYIRALARDLGGAVGSAAYLGSLVRTRSGPFSIDDAVTLDELRAAAAEAGPSGVARFLRPLDSGLESLPAVELDAAQVRAVVEGQFVRVAPSAGERVARADAPPEGLVLRLLAEDGKLVGIGRRTDGRVAPTKIVLDRGEPDRDAGLTRPAEPPAATAAPGSAEPVEASLASELDAPESIDPDPATPDA
ncbi:MAG TPA: tRNA pseudouridine(55) synthase TruB, partial [Candidatus Limnocylindrales bacterium]|nr:tRNA pseudouridine(55) synthase TruB [Candidatus Limnocylindrales bacterium]